MFNKKPPKCSISFTINPTLDNGFDIKMRYKKRKHLRVKIFGKSEHDILMLSKHIRREIMVHDNYITDICFRSCPKLLKQESGLRTKLVGMFIKPSENSHKIPYDVVKYYMDKYGKYPDMDNHATPFGRKKIKNYVENIFNRTVSETELDEIIAEYMNQ